MAKDTTETLSQRAPDVKVDPGAPSPEELKARYGRDMFRDFDIHDPAFNDKMEEITKLQQQYCPVVRSTTGEGYWWITRIDDIRRVGQDWRTFSNAQGYIPNRPEGLPYIYPLEMDPPKQTAWRRVLNPFLSPTVVETFAEPTREDTNMLIDRFIDKGGCEFISEFAAVLPGLVFFKNSIGLPLEYLEEIQHTLDRSLFGPVEDRGRQFRRTYELLEAYLIQRTKEPPRGDIIDVILKGVPYEDGTEASWHDKLCTLGDMVAGGIGTTTYALGSTLHHLANHPEDRRKLIERPDLMPNAVEEFIRAFPPVVGLGRTCTRDVEVAGTQMKKGDWLIVGWGPGSRDPNNVVNPDHVDIEREEIIHTTFGVGPHRCIGAHLARVELRVVFEEWLKRIPDFSVKPGTKPEYETSALRNMVSLHLVW